MFSGGTHYHELFHWRSSRHMKRLDLNSTQFAEEFLKQRKKHICQQSTDRYR